MRTISLLCLAALAGCTGMQPSTAPSGPTRVLGSGNNTTVIQSPDVGTASATVTASPDAGWRALSTAYQELGIPVTTVNQPALYLGNLQFKTGSRIGGKMLGDYFDCGSDMTGNIANHGELIISTVSQLKPAGDGQLQVTTQVKAVGRPRGGTSTDYSPCRSTGRLEQRVGDLVAQALSSAQP